MSYISKIEWTDATWNPVTGCSKVSEGCRNCYALRDWARLSKNPKSVYYGRKFTDVKCHQERLDQPLRWTKPRMIFVNSMSDLFHESVPDEFIDQVFAVMALAKHHRFQVLTKRPKRMLHYFTHHFTRSKCARFASEFSGKSDSEGGGDITISDGEFPFPNIWLGVSVENQQAADERIPLLFETPAAVRWVSAEPLLGPIDIWPYIRERVIKCGCGFNRDEHNIIGAIKEGCIVCNKYIITYQPLNWIVVGGESGPDARPMHPEWARYIRDQCEEAGVPFLFKQWGEFAPENSIHDDGSHSHDSFRRNATLHVCEKAERVYRVGKKRAGRLLDDRQYDGYPTTNA